MLANDASVNSTSPRSIAALAAGALAGGLLAAVQFGSMATLRSAALEGSVPRRLTLAAGAQTYAAIAAVVPLAFVEQMAARGQLALGQAAAAQHHIERLPPGRDRQELLAQMLALRGDRAAALAAYLEAGDVPAVNAEVSALDGSRDVAGAIALQKLLIRRLDADRTHHDALAEAWFHLGELHGEAAVIDPRYRSTYRQWAADDYDQAIKLAPITEKYLLYAGSAALLQHRIERAARFFEGALSVDPASASAFAGLGEVALANGDQATARRMFESARARDAQAASVLMLGRKLRT